MASLILGQAIPAVAQPTPVGLQLGQGAEQRAQATSRIVGSILSYSRWAVRPNPIRLCIVGPASHASKLGATADGTAPPVIRREFAADAVGLSANCDAVYLGRLGMTAMRRITASVRGTAVVTIAEADPECASEAMFCLVFAPSMLSFRINVDAISRSRVRIDPRVLRVARAGEAE